MSASRRKQGASRRGASQSTGVSRDSPRRPAGRWTSAVSALLLLVLIPVFAVLAIAILVDSRGRVIYRQRRVGRDLEPFTVNKFRTMHSGAGHETHRQYVLGLIAAEQGDLRGRQVQLLQDGGRHRGSRASGASCASRASTSCRSCGTCCAATCRSSARGRRCRTRSSTTPHWLDRLAVKPGITGLWQVSGRSQLGLEEMIALDVETLRALAVAEREDPGAHRAGRLRRPWCRVMLAG